jgi:hypothetical protein
MEFILIIIIMQMALFESHQSPNPKPFENNLIYKFTTSVRPCVRDGARVRHRRTTGPGPALPDSRISTHRARRGGCRAGSVTESRPALWSPARVERARPLSGSQHGRSVAWRRSAALLQAREEEKDRGEKPRSWEPDAATAEVLKPRSWEPNAATPDTGGLCSTVTVTH